MSEEELLRFVSEMEGAYYDYPFDEDFETAIFRRKDTKKWFGALLYAPNDKLSLQPKGGKTRVLNVKVPPELGVILKENYAGVLNAYHMNKTHWVSVLLSADVSREEIEKLLALSFELTGKRSKHERL